MKLIVFEALQDLRSILGPREIGRKTDNVFPVFHRSEEIFEAEATARKVFEERIFVHSNFRLVDCLVDFFGLRAENGGDGETS